MRVIVDALAAKELDDGATYYDLQNPGLGRRFKGEIRKAINRISDYPLAWSIETRNVRKCLVHTFPYKILYSVEHDHIYVIAIAHQHRRPNYWADSFI